MKGTDPIEKRLFQADSMSAMRIMNGRLRCSCTRGHTLIESSQKCHQTVKLL